MRIDLGDGDWAELRHANKIPRQQTLDYREVFFRAAGGGGDIEPIEELSEKEIKALSDEERAERDRKTKVNVKVIMESGGLKTMEDLADALVLAVVKDWSFGEVTLEVLRTVPQVDLDVIQEHCAGEEYRKVLTPDFDDKTDRSEGSPT